MFGHFTNDFIGVNIDGTSTYRYAQLFVFTAFTCTVTATAVFTTLRFIKALETIVNQSVEVFISDHIHIAAITTITTIRAAIGNEFFTPEAHNTVAAITSLNFNYRFIYEFHFSSTQSRGKS
ncbi:Uncharacterised protein [Vibrio cholerae]|nr:Uncharacterised protein [Vibrio cholerae]CSA74060.1 Uncharacterised protein [Vibrio cholerae]CSB98898.1 Uncharacterised protein [Vibrio cholerae]